jgi:hypothetical protein
MKQGEMASAIDKRFGKIDKLFHEVLLRFEFEPVHEYRTGIKKLRAHFRLMNVEMNDDRKLKIPGKLKTFYGYAGTIRNLQLQIKSMDAYVEEPGLTASLMYIQYLEKMIEKWKAHAIELAGPVTNFNHDEKKIINQLPGNPGEETVKKFIQNKINELERLLKELPNDDALHNIRKVLKDILYNWPFIQSHKKLLPLLFSEKEEIKASTELLGLFMDKSVAVNLLETYCRDCEENGLFFEKEIKELKEIENEWKKEKEDVAHVIYLKFGQLHLLTAN